ncbi:helix-turn-helix domain-containing protein [Elizabethkingia argentiflava]|uniref:Helix-turn-helix domain-containing protein n=1 Tax=Elizabethkingia argenteiflava TaxID=2681556 RepID=A0A845PZV9_9FLAO|nr:helix-turn-helix domain-containing protein [Elizabethkingia argenteiflava]NAW51898.1 helix-turn-helix domain-containing protein [Elizabethkingia argenteiflava]
MKKIISVIFCFHIFLSYAQPRNAYDKVSYKIFSETSGKNFAKALETADSLYTASGTSLQKIKSLMLSARIYQQAGDIKKSISYALSAENIIQKTDNSLWKAYVYSFLSTQYRVLKLQGQAEKALQKAFKATEEIQDPNVANLLKSKLWQEMTYHEISKKNYAKSIQYTLRAQQLIKDNYPGAVQNHFVELASNELSKEGSRQKAEVYILLALEKLERLGQTASISKQYQASNANYITVDFPTESSLNQTINNDSADIYTLQHRNRIKNWIILVISLCLVGNIILFSLYKRKLRKNLLNFSNQISTNEKATEIQTYRTPMPFTHVPPQKKFQARESEPSVIMTSAMEQKILAKLREFESSKLFTRKNISLSYLATYCDINSRYLSHIINTHKKKDFNNYINELRIKYIVDKLKQLPQYRKYKVATLADEAGFSSPNKFATIFKKEVSVPPSLYIKELEEQLS